MSARSAGRPEVVSVRSLTDVAASVPHLLGFHPTESIVAIALCGKRQRMSFSMRLDLLDPAYDEDVAQMCAARMLHAGAVSVVLVLYTDRPSDDVLPRQELVEAVQRALPMSLCDALLVADGRMWSYLCADRRCCPAEGVPLQPDSPGALALAAAHALQGDVVLPDRDAVVATTRPVGGVAATSMRQALDRAVAELARGDDVLADSMALVDAVTARYADPPAALTHDEAATLTLRTHHVLVRDAMLGRIARGDEATRALVVDLARLAQPPVDAPAATMLAAVGYLRGDGVVAVAAAERALGSDRDYSLAQLLLEAVHRQLDPEHLREVWAREPG